MSLLRDRLAERHRIQTGKGKLRILKHLFFLALVISIIILLNRFVGVVQ